MTVKAGPTLSLAEHLAWLRIRDCTCDFQWKSLGRLDGISMGDGWVRITTDPGCRHHA